MLTYFISDEYLTDLDGVFNYEQFNKDNFTLYDIIQFIYIKFYAEKVGITIPKKVSVESSNFRISEYVRDVSAYMGCDDYNGDANYYNEDDVEFESAKEIYNNDMKHYKGFQTQAIRDIEKFLNIVFNRKDALSLFQHGKAKVFNVLDFTFFEFLLHPSIREEVNLLKKHQYLEINNKFYMVSFIGISLLCRHHDLELKETDIPIIWRDRFGVNWANQSTAEIKQYIFNNLLKITD